MVGVGGAATVSDVWGCPGRWTHRKHQEDHSHDEVCGALALGDGDGELLSSHGRPPEELALGVA